MVNFLRYEGKKLPIVWKFRPHTMLIFATPSKRGFGLDVHSAVNEKKEWGQTSTIHSSRGFRVNVKECGMRDVPDKLTFLKDGAVKGAQHKGLDLGITRGVGNHHGYDDSQGHRGVQD
jgi:hypothetical protein